MRWFWPSDGLVHEVKVDIETENDIGVMNAYCNMVGHGYISTDEMPTCLPCIAFKMIERTWLEDWHYRRKAP